MQQIAYGFTLVELLVVMAIAAILGTLAAPSFRAQLQANRLTAASAALQSSLILARSEAVKRGPDAVVTIAANTQAGQWENGWTVFVDGRRDANGQIAPTVDSADYTLLEVVAAPSMPIQVSSTTSAAPNYITYNGRGRVVTTTGAIANRAMWFFDANSDKYCLVVNPSGRVRQTHVPSDQACPDPS